MKRKYTIFARWLALSLNLITSTDLLDAAGPVMVRKYEGTGTMTQTATTHYGNRASATCTRATGIEAVLYSDGSATLTLKYDPFFVFSLGNPNPALGLPPTLGNVKCADTGFTSIDPDPYYGTYSFGEFHNKFSVSTRGEKITGSFNDDTLSGSLEFTGTRSLTIDLDGSTGELMETKTLKFTIPITFLAKLLVKGTVKDFYGQPVAARLYWDREHVDISPFRYFSSDQNGHFEFDAVDPTPTQILNGSMTSWGDSPYHPFLTTVLPPKEDVTITLVPNTVMGENGVLLNVEGTVKIKYPETGIWLDAQVGMMLIRGVEIRTGPDSHAWGLLAAKQADRSSFYLGENTHIRNLNAPNTIGYTIRMFFGTLWYKAKSLLKGRHEIETFNAVAGGIGTEVRFESSSEGDTITLIEGRVEVRPVALPEELIILNPGERFHVNGAVTELEQLSERELEPLRDTLDDFGFRANPPLKFDFESEQQAGVWFGDASGSWRVTEGMYVMTGALAGVETYSYFFEELRDLTFEADLRKIEGDSPGAFTEYGMRFRSDGTSNNFYQFAITTDRLYSVGKMVAGVFTPLIGWTRSEALNLGHGAWNRLKAVAQGVEMTFYANGELLNRVEDASLTSGKAGLFAEDGASSQPRDTVQFDNAALALATGGGTGVETGSGTGGGIDGLIHQYSFNEGRGTTVSDSVGNSNGEIKGQGYVWGAGSLTLPGGPSASAAYVDLPNGILSSLESATIEAWVTVNASNSSARILDFGSSTAGELESPGGFGSGVDYLILTASVNGDMNWQRLAFADEETERIHFADTYGSAMLGLPTHVAVVVDPLAEAVRYYRNGELYFTLPSNIRLAEVSDVNNWLGRANETREPNLSGSYLEFRIYDRALSGEEVRISFMAGADAGGSGGGTVAPPPQITDQPQSVSVTAGDAVVFRVAASGMSPLSYQWRRNGQPIGGATSTTLELSSVSATDAGEYTAVVSNAAGSVTSAAAVLNVVSGGCLAVPSGLVGWWTGDGTIADAAGGHPGTLKNGAGYASGNVGEGFVFDGVDDFIEVPDSDLWAFAASDFTIELWAKFNSLAANTSLGYPAAVFLGNDAGAGESPKWFFSYGGGFLTFLNSRDFMAEAAFAPVLRQWYHLAVRRTGSTYSIFVDGRQVSSEQDEFVIPNPAAPLTIGQAEGLGFFDGQLDEISIYNRALSDAQLRAIQQAGSNGKCKVPSGGSGSGGGIAGLIHQYTFNEGGGTTVEDRVGNANAVVKGEGYTWGTGMLTLPGGPSTSAAYVDLPNGIISALTDATFEAWLTVDQHRVWARIFDFGSTSAPGGELDGPGGDGAGVDYILLSASIGGDSNHQRVEIRDGDSGRGNTADPQGHTTLGEEFHVAVVFESGAGEIRYYRNGSLLAKLETEIRLAEINDVNNWVGRSNWTADENLQGKLNEFRIYDRALSEEEVRNSYAVGADTGGSTAQAPQIRIVIDANGNVVLTFEGTLHSADGVAGPFAEVPGAVSPLTFAPGSTRQFYRAVRP